MNKTMQRRYKGIARTLPWTWAENPPSHESYLYLAGHRVATVKLSVVGCGFDSYCLGNLVASRKSLSKAKLAAEDATRAWLNEACLADTEHPAGVYA